MDSREHYNQWALIMKTEFYLICFLLRHLEYSLSKMWTVKKCPAPWWLNMMTITFRLGLFFEIYCVFNVWLFCWTWPVIISSTGYRVFVLNCTQYLATNLSRVISAKIRAHPIHSVRFGSSLRQRQKPSLQLLLNGSHTLTLVFCF